MLRIGCHLSSSKGYLAMGREAVNIKAGTFQFFTRNPRGGNAKAIVPSDVKDFLDLPGSMTFPGFWGMRPIPSMPAPQMKRCGILPCGP